MYIYIYTYIYIYIYIYIRVHDSCVDPKMCIWVPYIKCFVFWCQTVLWIPYAPGFSMMGVKETPSKTLICVSRHCIEIKCL